MKLRLRVLDSETDVVINDVEGYGYSAADDDLVIHLSHDRIQLLKSLLQSLNLGEPSASIDDASRTEWPETES